MDFTGGQFPALDGHPDAEVAQRTEPDTVDNWFRKVFTVHNRTHTVGLDQEHDMHRTNFGAVVQAALQQGLHPKCAPELESESPHPFDPNSTDLTYRVQVVPASVDGHPETTVTPSVLPTLWAGQSVADRDSTAEPEQGEGGVGGETPPPLEETPAETPVHVEETVG